MEIVRHQFISRIRVHIGRSQLGEICAILDTHTEFDILKRQITTTFQLIGVILTLACFSMETPVCWLCDVFSTSRIFVLDAFVTICLLANVCFWRGIWSFLDENIGRLN